MIDENILIEDILKIGKLKGDKLDVRLIVLLINSQEKYNIKE